MVIQFRPLSHGIPCLSSNSQGINSGEADDFEGAS